MPKVTMHGSNGKRTLNLPTPTEKNPQPENKKQVSAHNRRASFARMRELQPRLKALGSSDTAIWEGIKRKANVTSRATLTPSNWAIVAAQLQGALQSHELLKSLIERYDNQL